MNLLADVHSAFQTLAAALIVGVAIALPTVVGILFFRERSQARQMSRRMRDRSRA